MGRIDKRYYFTDDRRNHYHIHMTDHTQGPQYDLVALCKFIFDNGINVPNMRGWVKVESSWMYLVETQCPLFDLLDHESQAENPNNWLSFTRNGNQITINHFGPFGLDKSLRVLEQIRKDREKAEIAAKENESERRRLEGQDLRTDNEEEFPSLLTIERKLESKRLKALEEIKAIFGELQVRKEAVKAGKDIAEIIAKATAMTTARSGVKKLPVLGFAAGIGFGVWRAVQGDFAGAGLEVASGVASLVPGVGMASSIGIDVALFGRDLYEIRKKVKEEEMQKALQEEEELKEWEALKDTMIMLQEKIKECKDAEDGYNHCVKGCDILIELYEAADGAKK